MRTKNSKRNTLNWQGLLIVVSILAGCSQKSEYCETPQINLDSLFRIGDSVLTDLYIDQAQQKMYHDSLSGEVSSYQIRLSQKNIQEQQNRIIYKDTIIYRKKTKTFYDTIRKNVYLTDTIRDTIYLTKRELKKRK